MSHRYAISLEDSPYLTDDSYEIARLWVRFNGPSTIFINAHTMPNPASFGRLLADAARNGAAAYAEAQGISEADAMERIWEGFDRERGGAAAAAETSEGLE